MFARLISARKKDEGFTLIELLVVVIIIGILAAIAIPVFLNQRATAAKSAITSDVRNGVVQIETLATNDPNGAYPLTAAMTAAELAKLPLSANNKLGNVYISADGKSFTYCVEAKSGPAKGASATYSSTSGTITGPTDATACVAAG